MEIPRIRKPKSTYLLGLTGGIASGKSFVTHELKKLGAWVVDADVMARDVVLPGSRGLRLVKREFGDDMLRPDGKLDRKKLASVIFHDARKRKRLERILHPLIIQSERKALRAFWKAGKRGIFVVSAALIFEAGSASSYDAVAVVWCKKRQQVERLRKRDGLNRREALARIESQMPLREKRKPADFVIDNSVRPSQTRRKLRLLYKDWERMVLHMPARV